MMINIPFFSVIIPCYNSRSYLNNTIRSLEQQTFMDFEVILVDDCSTDDTYLYCEERARESDIDIRVYKNSRNCGPGFSRNVGIKKAKGHFICFCDSDDWYEKKFFELIYQAILDTNADIVFYNYYRCFSSAQTCKKVLINHTAPFVNCKTKADYIALATDSLCSIVVKHELFSEVSIANLYNAEDAITIPILITAAEKFSFLSEPLYNYNYRYGSLSTAPNSNAIENFWNAFLFLQENLEEQYREAFEFHCVKVIVYGLLHNAVRCNIGDKSLNKKMDDFQKVVPDWYHNKYLCFLPFRKRVWMRFAKLRCFFMLRLYYKLQRFYFKNGLG
ncbi:glycosyltransferase family 2 protein [Bacteroides fragilis]|uniref:glycosyltransferase family 2 protein n=2 Tax=Bacteroides fragilis TaxID=817 RepID=UPI00293F537C|nr:glycosyltransferase family 2 protein [Bacteroides fragilis]